MPDVRFCLTTIQSVDANKLQHNNYQEYVIMQKYAISAQLLIFKDVFAAKSCLCAVL